ncbi:MAG: M13 family metallopeptidase [Acidobacteriota bacterium]|nr:M13 family metallopeptidase [Acidobacteriota bacterium]
MLRNTMFVLMLVPAGLFAQTPAGVDLKAMDRTADPCSDFYQYACGGWMKANPVPADQSSWSRFQELAERNRLVLQNILENAASRSGLKSAIDKQLGDFYASCMDEEGIERRGIAPVQPWLDKIGKLQDKKALSGLMADIERNSTAGGFFGIGSGQDAKDSTKVIAQLFQGGLGLPDREYYLKTDPKSVELRTKYQTHVQRTFELLGHTPERAKAEAAAVLRIETALAKVALDRVSLRDPNKRYHIMTVAELQALTPLFDWNAFLKGVGVTVSTMNVVTPDFFQGLEQTLENTSLDDLKSYLDWHLARGTSNTLPKKFVEENFDFYNRTLTGAKEMQPRWKRCVTATDRALGEELGKKFVDQTFGPSGKDRTLRMVGEIEAAMAKDIESIDWMSPETKKQALAKLHAVANKIGYPEHWRDYSSIKIARGDALGNQERASAFEFQRRLSKIGKPVDKQEWGMTPPTVNAYYNPPENNINFPAGILQPPFYYKSGDEAVNYGAIGAVVGHELTHGFDDTGRQYDGEGNVRDWWTAEDAAEFKKRADCIVNEYGNFVAVGDVKQNGRLTLGENAADNGGIRLAYMALMDSLAKHTVSNAKVDGLTPEQRFFVGFAQIWCQNQTDEAARLQAQTNPHSLGRYRTNGVVQNVPEFQQAFMCKAGQPMVSATPCRVW